MWPWLLLLTPAVFYNPFVLIRIPHCLEAAKARLSACMFINTPIATLALLS